MRKKVALVFILFITFASTSFAQRESGDDYDPLAKPNIIKLNLTSLIYKNIAIQYERVLGQKISVACGVRLMPKSSLPFTKTYDNFAQSDSADLSALKVSSFAITPEFRFYPKHAGKGFYLAPYFRYRIVNTEIPIDYVDDNSAQQRIFAKGKFNSFIGGLMIGSQFNLGPTITLDWFIIGAQYGVTNSDLTVTTTKALSANDQKDIRASLEDFKSSSNSFNNLQYTVNANGGTINGNISSVGFRGFGLNLGIRF